MGRRNIWDMIASMFAKEAKRVRNKNRQPRKYPKFIEYRSSVDIQPEPAKKPTS